MGGGIHTVNERMFIPLIHLKLFAELGLPDIAIDGFLEKIRFFTTLILNADEATNI